MLSVHADSAQTAAARTENQELRDAMRVLGAVVEELSERVELLETRENLRSTAA